MKVLSLFNGISCGRIALERAGISVERYVSFEIDKYANQVAKVNYPHDEYCGDVTTADFTQFRGFDLLIGGSPCQGFSTAGKELNFNDPRSKLFFEFVRALRECQPKYFLLENVNMKPEFRDIISNYLGVEPIMINSSLVSGQNRPRWYWTNIPNVEQPKDKHISVADALDIENIMIGQPQPFPRDYKKKGLPRFERIEYRSDGKSNAIITNPSKNQVKIDGGHRLLTIAECEILQTLPIGYVKGLPYSKAVKAIGNSWTVDVVSHILNYINSNVQFEKIGA